MIWYRKKVSVLIFWIPSHTGGLSGNLETGCLAGSCVITFSMDTQVNLFNQDIWWYFQLEVGGLSTRRALQENWSADCWGQAAHSGGEHKLYREKKFTHSIMFKSFSWNKKCWHCVSSQQNLYRKVKVWVGLDANLLEASPHLRQRKPLCLCQFSEEDQPAWVAQPCRAPADLPEGDGSVGRRHVPLVNHLCLPQPLVRLGEGDEVTLGSGLRVEMAKPGMGMMKAQVLHLSNRQNCCSSRLLLSLPFPPSLLLISRGAREEEIEMGRRRFPVPKSLGYRQIYLVIWSSDK